MKANKIQILTIVVLSGVSLSVEAQEPDSRLNREMTLEREYDPTVQDASKVNRLPEVKDPEVTRRSIDYSPFTVPADPEKDFTVLPSGSILTEIPYNKRRGYFHFGGGMFMNLNGDAGYHILDTGKDLLNLYLSHRSTNGEVEYLNQYPAYPQEGKQKAVLNDNLAGLGFRHQFTGSVLRLGAEYGYTAFNYYGWPLLTSSQMASSVWHGLDSLANRTDRQANQTVRGYAGIRSNRNAKIGYTADIDWTHFSQKYGRTKEVKGLSEDRITGLLDLNVRLGEKEQRAGLTARLNYFNYVYPFIRVDSLGYRNYLETTLTPYYRIDGETWHVKLGANVMLITGDSSRLFVSPNIAAEMQIANRTVFYVNAGGEIGSNDAAGLAHRNRYIDYFSATLPSRTWLDATAGIRSGVTRDFWLSVFAGYKIIENAVFFVPYRNDLSEFGNYSTALQPDAAVFDVGAMLKYSYRGQVDVSLKGVYHNASFSSSGDNDTRTFGPRLEEMLPFGFPEVEINAGLTVKPVQPLTLALDYYLGANRCTWLYGEIAGLNNLNDLNLTASWNFNDTFGVYAKLNNLLFQKQELWYGYPMQSFNAMAGININF
ncbi:MAG: TonB-dependent receptor [Tannerella sp.]|jgi:hypothetical protein|nr:TonB-dependent receptor [Tannerella sp.]